MSTAALEVLMVARAPGDSWFPGARTATATTAYAEHSGANQ